MEPGLMLSKGNRWWGYQEQDEVSQGQMRVKSSFINVLVMKGRTWWLPGLWVGTDVPGTDVPKGTQGAAGMLLPLGCGQRGDDKRKGQ